jgi:hypothetical protein
MRGRSISYKVLSGTSSYVTVAPALPTDNNVVAFYRVDPTLSAADIVHDVSNARLAEINVLCFVVAQKDLTQTPKLLDPYVETNLHGLAFCLCIEKATNEPEPVLIKILTAISNDKRYLKRNGRAVVVVEPIEISNDLTAWKPTEDFYLIVSIKNSSLSQQQSAVDSVLIRNSIESIGGPAQYMTAIESSITESLMHSERCLYATGCINVQAAKDSRYPRLFGIWIHYLRMIARENGPIRLLFIERWSEISNASRAEQTSGRSSLSLITEIARSGWASPPHANDFTLSLNERIAADLLFATQERAAQNSAPSHIPWTWARLKHSCRNWLRSCERLHRPLRALRNALLSCTRGNS